MFSMDHPLCRPPLPKGDDGRYAPIEDGDADIALSSRLHGYVVGAPGRVPLQCIWLRRQYDRVLTSTTGEPVQISRIPVAARDEPEPDPVSASRFFCFIIVGMVLSDRDLELYAPYAAANTKLIPTDSEASQAAVECRKRPVASRDFLDWYVIRDLGNEQFLLRPTQFFSIFFFQEVYENIQARNYSLNLCREVKRLANACAAVENDRIQHHTWDDDAERLSRAGNDQNETNESGDSDENDRPYYDTLWNQQDHEMETSEEYGSDATSTPHEECLAIFNDNTRIMTYHDAAGVLDALIASLRPYLHFSGH